MINNILDNSALQLWQCRVGENTLQIEKSTQALLSHSECYRFTTINSPDRKREYLLGRALIRHAFSNLYVLPVSHWQLTEHANALPTVDNLPTPLHFSLSHSKGRICLATSKFAVGVDIEKIVQKKNLGQIAEIFMSESELTMFKNLSEQDALNYFYQVWCSKEAYFKTLPFVQQRLFKAQNLSIQHLADVDSKCQLINISSDNYACHITLMEQTAKPTIQLFECFDV